MSDNTSSHLHALPNWITTVLACVIAVVAIVNADNSNHNTSKDALAVIESKLDISTILLQNLKASDSRTEATVRGLTGVANDHETRITVLETKHTSTTE